MTVTYDILHLAFQADLARVFTFLLGHGQHQELRAHRRAGSSPASHGGGGKLAKCAIGAYHILKMAEFARS